MTRSLLTEDQRDCLEEITNVAMGQAGDRLARLLDVFVILSIPHVSVLKPTDIVMALQALNRESEEPIFGVCQGFIGGGLAGERSEEHMSELQSRENLVCRLLLEKKKKQKSDQASRE